MVKDPKMLRKHYFKSVSYGYDVISLLPTDIAYYWWRPGSCDAVSIISLELVSLLHTGAQFLITVMNLKL